MVLLVLNHHRQEKGGNDLLLRNSKLGAKIRKGFITHLLSSFKLPPIPDASQTRHPGHFSQQLNHQPNLYKNNNAMSSLTPFLEQKLNLPFVPPG